MLEMQIKTKDIQSIFDVRTAEKLYCIYISLHKNIVTLSTEAVNRTHAFIYILCV